MLPALGSSAYRHAPALFGVRSVSPRLSGIPGAQISIPWRVSGANRVAVTAWLRCRGEAGEGAGGSHAHRHGAGAVGAGCRAPSEPVRSFLGAPLGGFGVEALGRVREGAAIIRTRGRPARAASSSCAAGTGVLSGATDVRALRLRGMGDDGVFAYATPSTLMMQCLRD
ncbi:unnamed protein product [Miscanthus lutarioriparius]|uniref:Uncharacterized protein n=1 Tax=Miscanthus lutarioriparius TaxID=422564 RepID=A0A811R9K2_9POAL|nr:unnamed protein product [Miscanthus lutarioriparius]